MFSCLKTVLLNHSFVRFKRRFITQQIDSRRHRGARCSISGESSLNVRSSEEATRKQTLLIKVSFEI